MILFIDVIVMPSSFLVACFVNDCSIFANHNLCLYGMCFLLSRIVRFASSIIYWPWNLLFCGGIYKSKKAQESIVQLLQVFVIFLSIYIFFVELANIFLSNLQSFVYLCIRYSDPNQIESQPECK